MKGALGILLAVIVWGGLGCSHPSVPPSVPPAPGVPDRPGPSPEQNDLAKMTADRVICIHQEMRNAQSVTHLNLARWQVIAGWKLYNAVLSCTPVREAQIDTPAGERLFELLLGLLQNQDGRVADTVDGGQVSRALFAEYEKILKGK